MCGSCFHNFFFYPDLGICTVMKRYPETHLFAFSPYLIKGLIISSIEYLQCVHGEIRKYEYFFVEKNTLLSALWDNGNFLMMQIRSIHTCINSYVYL